MKSLYPILALLVCLILSGCNLNPTPIVLPQGPVATQLGTEKDKQIAGLVAQVKSEQDARLLEQALASKAASSIKGILKVRDYLPEGPPSDAIKAEGDLALTRLPKDDPAETVKALERVVAIVTGQRDEANRLYQAANAETNKAKAEIAAKDREIVARDGEIQQRDAKIAQLTKDAKAEQIAHAKDVQDTIDRLTKEAQEAERKTIMLYLGIGAIALILGGIVVIAISQGRLIIQGSILSAGGGLVILLRLAYQSLVAAPWFPYAAAVVVAIILATVGWTIWRLWVKHQLDDRKTQAIQDYIDEKTAKGDVAAAEDLKEHLVYRMGDKSTFWGKAQASETAKLGLVNPTGEAALKAAQTSVTPTDSPPKS